MFYEITDIEIHPGERTYTVGTIIEIFDKTKPLVKGDPWIIKALIGYDR